MKSKWSLPVQDSPWYRSPPTSIRGYNPVRALTSAHRPLPTQRHWAKADGSPWTTGWFGLVRPVAQCWARIQCLPQGYGPIATTAECSGSLTPTRHWQAGWQRGPLIFINVWLLSSHTAVPSTGCSAHSPLACYVQLSSASGGEGEGGRGGGTASYNVVVWVSPGFICPQCMFWRFMHWYVTNMMSTQGWIG